MWYPPKTVTPPATEPVSLNEAKRQVNAIDFPDDDELLIGLIVAARSFVEKYCAAKWTPQIVEMLATGWADFCRLPVTPVTSITSIVYIDSGGAQQTLADTVYELRGEEIVLKAGQSWPAVQSGSLLTVTVVAGQSLCPPDVKHAMLLWIAEAYLNRESAALAGWSTLDALLCNHRY